MPASVAGILGRGEPDGKCTETSAAEPTPGADQLVEGRMQNRCVRGRRERSAGIVAEADDWPGPGRGIVRIAAGVAPKDAAAFIREVARKGGINSHVAVMDELRDLGGRQHAPAIL